MSCVYSINIEFAWTIDLFKARTVRSFIYLCNENFGHFSDSLTSFFCHLPNTVILTWHCFVWRCFMAFAQFELELKFVHTHVQKIKSVLIWRFISSDIHLVHCPKHSKSLFFSLHSIFVCIQNINSHTNALLMQFCTKHSILMVSMYIIHFFFLFNFTLSSSLFLACSIRSIIFLFSSKISIINWRSGNYKRN